MDLPQPQLSAPGVYVQEVPAGKHHITGVSTSVTAFLGRAATGPVDTPTIVRSFGEYLATFGRMRLDLPMAYCVQDFFNNGGTEAMIVRLFEGDAGGAIASLSQLAAPATSDDAAAKAAAKALTEAQAALDAATAAAAAAKSGKPKTDADKAVDKARGEVAKRTTALAEARGGVAVDLVAASPGGWGNRVTYTTDRDGISAMVQQRFANEDWDGSDLFNLKVVRDLGGGRSVEESFTNISLNPLAGGRHLAKVLENGASLARLAAGPVTAQQGRDSGHLSVATYLDGLQLLEKVDIFNLLVIPPDAPESDTDSQVLAAAAALCEKRRAFLVVDAPVAWEDNPTAVTPESFAADLGISAASTAARHAAVYFPRIVRPDPNRGNFPASFPCSGAVAGTIARTDRARGIWKAPAGLEAGLLGATGVSYVVGDHESGHLNKQGVNCIRSFGESGPVVWGARTMRGSDQLSDDFQFVPLRRLANYIEETLQRNTKWAVFEPNATPLWSNLRMTITAFMRGLFQQGAFAGAAGQAFFVNCDATTTTADDIERGVVNVVVGYAPLKPAEFVVLYIQQNAGE